MLQLPRASQRLYYPEFLPDETWPIGLPAPSAPDAPRGVSESFGTLRYGQLEAGLIPALLHGCSGAV